MFVKLYFYVSFCVGVKLHRLRVENRPRVFEKGVLRRLFEPESLEKTAQWGVPYLYPSANIYSMMNQER
jgi:hypothetical protein